MSSFKWAMSRWLFFGLLAAALCVLIGEIFYLMQAGALPMPALFSSSAHVGRTGLWIQAGLFLLVLFQLIRVLLAGFFFVRIKDKVFMVISAFILLMLIYSVFFVK
ncbi:MAG: hypothetical protein A2X77_05945 [Gammaproteobacteria bacterium GWE2_42_36]|nr:MAG: hypothetical protein A2X77_05945 [Gammaproteobacteria bacterium GWE2_42_36]HCU05093.1 hypothetical protein [Coxiellaceae bacterium]